MSKQIPCLMMFPYDEDEESYSGCSIYSVRENMTASGDFLDLPGRIHCSGSSCGWLVMLYKKTNIFLFNPNSGIYITLPVLDCQSEFAFDGSKLMSKAILSSGTFKKKNCWAMAIYGRREKLGYCQLGTSQWVNLNRNKNGYHDIIYYNDFLFALSGSLSIEIWDFLEGNQKKLIDIIQPIFPEKALKKLQAAADLYLKNYYIVRCKDQILLVTRKIGERVNDNGIQVTEADSWTDESNNPLVFPYRTLFFHVYRLVLSEKKWVEVDNLGKNALFLGGGESMAVRIDENCKRIKGNCIYFTDDYWDGMEEDNLYGGHERGVFSLETHSIEKVVVDCNLDRIVPLLPFGFLGNV